MNRKTWRRIGFTEGERKIDRASAQDQNKKEGGSNMQKRGEKKWEKQIKKAEKKSLVWGVGATCKKSKKLLL